MLLTKGKLGVDVWASEFVRNNVDLKIQNVLFTSMNQGLRNLGDGFTVVDDKMIFHYDDQVFT